jgi:hypothetical protein
MSVAYFEEPITALDNRARSRSITNRFGRSMRCRSDSRSAVNRRTIRRCLNRCRRTTEAPERGPTSQGRSRYLERRRNYKRKSVGHLLAGERNIHNRKAGPANFSTATSRMTWPGARLVRQSAPLSDAVTGNDFHARGYIDPVPTVAGEAFWIDKLILTLGMGRGEPPPGHWIGVGGGGAFHQGPVEYVAPKIRRLILAIL